MHIRSVELENWLCYAGRQSVELSPTIYGIVGERVGEPESSNWVGKSAFLESLAFALFGDHRKRTEDEWITTGAERGMVEVAISDGTVLRRERKLGGPTRFQVRRPGGERYDGAEAQAYVQDRILGCSKDDYYLLFHARQKDLASLVSASHETFAQTIRSWLQLESLEAVEDRASEMVGRCADKLAELESVVQASLRDVCPDAPPNTDPVAAISDVIAELVHSDVDQSVRIGVLEAELETHRGRQQQITEWYRNKAALDSVVRMEGQLEDLELELAGLNVPAMRSELEALDAVVGDLRDRCKGLEQEIARVQSLIGGKFDGKCPLMSCADCPSRDKVAKWGLNQHRYVLQMKSKLDQDREELRVKLVEYKSISERVRSAEKLGQRVEVLREGLDGAEELRAYLREQGQPTDQEAVTTRIANLESKILAARSEHNNTKLEVGRVSRRLDEVRRAIANVGDSRTTMRRYSVIQRAAGRQGAQKLISQSAMARIEDLGNAQLAESGIDLSFRVRWTIEAKKLSKACECGHLYRGARERSCPRCMAERTMQALDKPGLELSDRSGAAEDLVGATLRFGASTWVRSRRSIGWGVVVIDEPFGALDAPNRDNFARYLTSSLLGRYGFQQGFIVAHHEDVMASMPGRLAVVGSQGGSRIKVV